LILSGDPCLALSTDRDQPIDIEADSAESDDLRRVTVYRGDVIINQGTIRITGDQVTLYRDEANDLKKMVSLGSPATFRQLPDGEPHYRTANAERMEYYTDRDRVILLGKAVYGKGADRVSADRIEYDSLSSRMTARSTAPRPAAGTGSGERPKSRVKIKIMPNH